MAEYKNGFSALGNVPISPDRRSSDLQTGRAVYVDEADYSADAKYKDKVDTVEYEGYHREAPIVVPEKGSSEGGGSGSSDFSTAQVTVVNNTTAEAAGGLLMAIINEDGYFVVNALPSGIYTVPLLNGVLHTAYVELRTISVSGNASEDDGDITITGDCTITIS